MLSIATALCAPELADHPVGPSSIDDSSQHAVVTQDSNLLVGAATRRRVRDKGSQPSPSQFPDEDCAILHRDLTLPGTVRQGSFLGKNGLLAADPFEVTRQPAHQINQVNSHVAHGAETHYFFLIAPAKRQIGIGPPFREPTRFHVEDTAAHVSFLHELFHPVKSRDKAEIEASHVNQACFFGPLQHCRRLFLVHRQRLFAENRNTVVEGITGHGKMNVGWRGQAHRIETALGKHLAVIGKNVWDAEFPGHSLGAGLCTLAECGNLYTRGCPVRQYVSPAEATTNDTDLYCFLWGYLCHCNLSLSFLVASKHCLLHFLFSDQAKNKVRENFLNDRPAQFRNVTMRWAGWERPPDSRGLTTVTG